MAVTHNTQVQLTTEFECSPSVIAQDMVYLSPVENRLVKALDNNPPEPVMGFVLRKLSQTTCEILMSGISLYSVPLSIGVLYLSPNGIATVTPPLTGFRQVIGLSFGDGNINFYPEYTRVVV